MDDFPDELLDEICAHMGKNELRCAVQVCRSLRRVGARPILRAWGIRDSPADLQSGALTVNNTGQLFLIPLYASLVGRITRLVCFANPFVTVDGPWHSVLRQILAALPPVPDILVHHRPDTFNVYAMQLDPYPYLAQLPAAADRMLVVVHGSTIAVSKPLPQDNSQQFALSAAGADERLRRDVPGIAPVEWIRLQMLPAVTLVTIGTVISSFPMRRILSLGPALGLDQAVLVSILRSMPSEDIISGLALEPHLALPVTALVSFLLRHPNVRELCVGPGALCLAPHDGEEADMGANRARIAYLEAPASYVPRLLRCMGPALARIGVSFSQDLDMAGYRETLAAIARLPGTSELSLTLAFPPATAHHFPWNTDASDKCIPAKLGRVTELDVVKRFHTLGELQTVVAWVAELFPAVTCLFFTHGSADIEPSSEARSVFERTVKAACPALESVHF
ncbi:unnamed protein product [Mycena citricolor]|uniref:F-box domain-containing protein n=1 Tax=Mycena citricolor TaxID=2018698 RepID=A0AAD2HG96_9AGAR|nr:unnamed protein product [Mycena citricolor]